MSGSFPWYVARSSGLVGWALLAAATLWGLALSTKVLGKRPRPNWILDLHRWLAGVAWGVIAFYLLVAVELTSLARANLSKQVWRRVHFASFLLFAMGTIHGLTAGTDTKSAAARIVSAVVGSVFAGLTALRISESVRKPPPAGPRDVPVRQRLMAHH